MLVTTVMALASAAMYSLLGNLSLLVSFALLPLAWFRGDTPLLVFALIPVLLALAGRREEEGVREILPSIYYVEIGGKRALVGISPIALAVASGALVALAKIL